MRVLLTNNTLAMRAGSELYVYDVALELLRRGHQPIAFSTVHGEVAAQLRAATIPVIDNLENCGEPPDIIHGHHHYETMAASLFFPETPAINFCHGWAPEEEEPVLFPRILRYVAVDEVCRDRLIFCFGIEQRRVVLLLNFVDTERFGRRAPLPERPRRALAFGNTFAPGEQLSAIENVCRDAGIELDVIGMGRGHATAAPEKLVPGYDIVFAKARAAIEAMAVGACVVLAGPRGFGPMVTPENWQHLRRINFGVRALSLPLSAEVLSEQLKSYDPDGAAAVCDLVRSQARLTDGVDRLLELYQEVIDEFRTMHREPGAAEKAASRYLTRYAPAFKGFGREYIRGQEVKRQRSLDAISAVFHRMAPAIAVPDGEIAGNLEVAVRQDRVVRVAGWVAHLPSRKPCIAVMLEQSGRFGGIAFPDIPRPDVNTHLNIAGGFFGFDVQGETADEGPIRVLAAVPTGELYDISSLSRPEIQKTLRGISTAD